MKLLMLAVLMGCAAANLTLSNKDFRPYKDSSQITKIDMPSKSVTINSVADLREMSDVGYAYTGVEYKKTPVFLGSEPAVFVRESFENGLRLRNISVVPNGDVNLEINIIDLQVHELIQKHQPEKAKCSLTLEFSGQVDRTQWNGKYSVEYISAGDLTDGTQRLAPTLASCVNVLMEKLISDKKFIRILKKEK